ncbi:hypothetical protein AKJ08_0036 [Vulgatibacter incomptus]|uniref:Uncharacterized protein n=1 Tax=Vulgatibacter incomptus TaxID=1391653 RepID=A0A0K1P966_9BACT|nr:hypothetical protein AKJ08_0036 [Vulgatibacter incomptus]
MFGDDVRINCGETSYEVVYGDGYHGCTFDSLDLDEDCRR